MSMKMRRFAPLDVELVWNYLFSMIVILLYQIKDGKANYFYGEARLGDLINRLIQDQRMEEIQMASTDPEKREQLYKEYGI